MIHPAGREPFSPVVRRDSTGDGKAQWVITEPHIDPCARWSLEQTISDLSRRQKDTSRSGPSAEKAVSAPPSQGKTVGSRKESPRHSDEGRAAERSESKAAGDASDSMLQGEKIVPSKTNIVPLSSLDKKTLRYIHANDKAIYGYSPRPDTKEGKGLLNFGIDFSSPVEVASAQVKRISYLKGLKIKKLNLSSKVNAMKEGGLSLSDIGTKLVNKRNQGRAQTYIDDGNHEGLKAMQQKNLADYGRIEGPSAENLFEQKGSWEKVIFGTVKSNRAMDIILGIEKK